MRLPNQSVGVMRYSHFSARTRRNNGVYADQISRTGLSGFAGREVEIRRDGPKLGMVSDLSHATCQSICSGQCSGQSPPPWAYLTFILCFAPCYQKCTGGYDYGPTSDYAIPGQPRW